MNEYYFEIFITPNNFVDLIASEISDFTNEAIEIASSAKNLAFLQSNNNQDSTIIVRTEKNMDFVDLMLKHLHIVCSNLSDINGTKVYFSHEIIKKQNKDWINEYKDSIKPIYCDRFYIRPPWAQSCPAESIDIVLEPSLAFGSGHHATTFMCIEAIRLCMEKCNNPISLLDVGCGSGILALCANKLGANVDMCDVDSLAIEQTKKNFLQNNATITRIWLGSIDDKSNDTYDIIVANLVASVLQVQSKSLIASLKRDSFLILSGILDKYRDCVIESFCDLELIAEKRQDEWICLIFYKSF